MCFVHVFVTLLMILIVIFTGATLICIQDSSIHLLAFSQQASDAHKHVWILSSDVKTTGHEVSTWSLTNQLLTANSLVLANWLYQNIDRIIILYVIRKNINNIDKEYIFYIIIHGRLYGYPCQVHSWSPCKQSKRHLQILPLPVDPRKKVCRTLQLSAPRRAQTAWRSWYVVPMLCSCGKGD